jgi:hypothetical protein
MRFLPRIAVLAVAVFFTAAFTPKADANQLSKKPAVVQTHKPPGRVINVTLNIRTALTPFQIEYRVARIMNGNFTHDHNLHVYVGSSRRVAATVQDCHVFDLNKQQFPDVSRWFDLRAWDTKTTTCSVNQGATAADPHGYTVWYPAQSTYVQGHDVVSRYDRRAKSDDLYFWHKALRYGWRKVRSAGRPNKKKGHHRVAVPWRRLRSLDGANGRVALHYSGCAGWATHPRRGKRVSSISYAADFTLTVNRCNPFLSKRYIHRYAF